MFFFSGSGYATTSPYGPGMITLNLYLDGVATQEVAVYGAVNVHTTFPTNAWVTTLNAGAHTVYLKAGANTTVDSNDLGYISLIAAAI
jgi:hypothetical protein